MGEKENTSKAPIIYLKAQNIWRTESTETTFANKCKKTH
jgi:hypothetical protein